MGREPGRRWEALAGMVALSMLIAITVTVSVTAATPAGATTRKGTTLAKAKLAQAGHATFWNCSAKTTVLLVAVNTLTLHPGASLDISFTVRNGAAASCNYTAPYAGAAPGPTSTALTAEPCGSVGYEIEGP